MIAQSIIKRNNNIIWHDYLLSTYSIATLGNKDTTTTRRYTIFNIKVNVTDDTKCCHCDSLLKDINEENKEEWICLMPIMKYYCPLCSITQSQIIKEILLKDRDSNMHIPHKLIDVHNAIESHRNFKKLDPLVRMEYDECVSPSMGRKKKPDDNKYIRKLWFHLYHQKEL